MKTCVALVLVSAILRLSAAGPRPSRDRKCRIPDPKDNFEPEKFFKNKWYTTHYQLTKYGLEDNTMNCSAFSSIVFSNGRIKEVFSNYQPRHCAYSYDVSYSSLDSFKDRVGKYTAQNVVVDRKGKRLEDVVREYTITIIDTDYTRYAFVHLCGQDEEGLYFDYYFINGRNQEDKVHPKITEAMKKYKLEIEGFLSSEDVVCQYDERAMNSLLYVDISLCPVQLAKPLPEKANEETATSSEKKSEN